ncbi:Gp37 family protein [Camelimonas lactis]|uniref:Gp37 protein n=1 Tax=Camelimonas lactis TaxID=659006 RepID=A0A4R2GW33_9HYPH|nr:Gp37 family protein [Camelimonas lactis]TCO15221.1 Gp37 protein [Camelimonas lactis]
MTDAPDIAAGNRSAATAAGMGETDRIVSAIVNLFEAGLPRDVHVAIMPDRVKDFDLGEHEAAALVHYRGSDYRAPETSDGIWQTRRVTIDVHLMVRGLTGRLGAPSLVDSSRITLQGKSVHGSTPFAVLRDGLVSENDGIWDYVISFAASLRAVAPLPQQRTYL